MLNKSMSSTKTYNCRECGKENNWSYQTQNIYCKVQCQMAWQFKNKTLVRFHEGVMTERATIRKCIIHERGNECSVCHITEWNGKPIVFQVDHIDGRADDNSPENLRLICANCHSQTPHFGGKNKGRGRKALGLPTR